MDPESFKALMSRPELIDCDTTSPHRTLLALDYLVTAAISLSAFAYATLPFISFQQQSMDLSLCLRLVPFTVWAWSQLHAWSSGSTSVIGALFSHYLVKQDPRYPLHFHTAGILQHIFVSVIETVFLGGTLFFGGLSFTILKLLFLSPWTSGKATGGDVVKSCRTVGQAAMGLVVIRQVTQKHSISAFPPSSSLPSSSNLTTPLPDPRAMRGEGLTASRVLSGSGWMAKREEPPGAAEAPRSTYYSWGVMFHDR